MEFNKKTIFKIIIHTINICYICLFIANWIFEIISSTVSLRLIMSRFALGGLIIFLILAEICPDRTGELF